VPRITIRQARTFLAVAESSSVTGAAKAINRSQTSVTKAIQDLEQELGVELFDRSSKGVTLTAFGKALQRSARQAAHAFESAGGLVPPLVMNESPGVSRFFHMDVSDKWLDAFLATAEHQNLAAAANELNLTTAAVSANLRKLEDTLHMTLFERLPNATIPNTFARSLIRYIKLARSHLRHACDELLSMKGVKTGRVTVGTLPFVRTLILPRAITRMRKAHPYLDVSTLDGRYDDLVTALRCGDIDFLVGALRGSVRDADLVEEPLLEDQLSLIVRSGHPLQTKSELDWPELLDYEWILPRSGTPTRTLFEAAIHSHGLESPQHVIETSSMALLRGLLVETNMVSVLSRHQIHYDEKNGILAALRFELSETRRPIGITRRDHSSMPPAAGLLVDELKAVAKEIEPSL
jgi:LysR family transcriptional regulator of gallate degradation